MSERGLRCPRVASLCGDADLHQKESRSAAESRKKDKNRGPNGEPRLASFGPPELPPGAGRPPLAWAPLAWAPLAWAPLAWALLGLGPPWPGPPLARAPLGLGPPWPGPPLAWAPLGLGPPWPWPSLAWTRRDDSMSP